jgi:hypothetical protein
MTHLRRLPIARLLPSFPAGTGQKKDGYDCEYAKSACNDRDRIESAKRYGCNQRDYGGTIGEDQEHGAQETGVGLRPGLGCARANDFRPWSSAGTSVNGHSDDPPV